MKLKNKSSKHSASNTYKFQTFSERLSSIHVDVARKVKRFASTPEDADTFFGEALQRWTDLNCTQHFLKFRREVVSEIQSLVQLVHLKDDVVNALQTHLKVSHSLAYQPLLDLVVQLARDLQGDFYPYFESFFHILVGLLNVHHHDVEVLEQVFSCLAYLFKFLWRTMLRDINNIYLLFSPLLGDEYREYINNFAAESFAFLIRKCKTSEDLLHFIFQNLTENTDKCHGAGRLIFESIKGVQKQLHSTSDKILRISLRSLSNDKLSQEQVAECLLTTWKALAEYTAPQSSSVIWLCLMDEIKFVHKKCQSAKKKVEMWKGSLGHLLQLVLTFIKHKHGCQVSLIGDDITKVLIELVKNNVLSGSGTELLLEVCSSLLLESYSSVLPHHRSALICQIYNSDIAEHIIIAFSRKLFSLPTFEKEVLPALLKHCHDQVVGTDADGVNTPLQLLAELVMLKAPSPQDASQLGSFVPYVLDFSSHVTRESKSGVPIEIHKILQNTADCDEIQENELARLWVSMVILPHLRPTNESLCYKVLESLIGKLYKTVVGVQDGKNAAFLCVWSEAIAAMLVMREKDAFYSSIDAESVAKAIREFSNSVHVLRAGTLYFSYAHDCPIEGEVFTEERFLAMFEKLKTNLSSPHSKIRLLTLQICCQFPVPMPPLPDDMAIEQIGVFKICQSAEEIESTVQTYRDKLIHIRKLDHSIVQNQTPVGPFETAALRYLLGLLYNNFTLLWKPVMQVIESHAKGLSSDVFWSVYGPALADAAVLAEAQLRQPQEDLNSSQLHSSQMNETADTPETLNAMFDKFHKLTLPDRPDHANFRYLLWEAMSSFPDVCQSKSRIFVPLFFQFLEKEYYPEDLTLAPTQDIRKRRGSSVEETDADVEAEESDDDEEGDKEDEEDHILTRAASKRNAEVHKHQDEAEEIALKRKRKDSKAKNIDCDDDNEEETEQVIKEKNYSKQLNKNENLGGSVLEDADISRRKPRQKRAPNKTLLVHLTVFSRFNSPLSLVMEPKLRNLYFDLLLHRDGSIQKKAFECIMTYKFKYLTPYKENFQRLMDDKTFKNEIVLFTIDEQDSVVVDEHRRDLLPVLMRILYGKMMSKTGKDSSGKAQSQFRKNIILRFLGGCKPDEIMIFLDLVFEPFVSYKSENLCAKIASIKENLDLSCVIPIRKFTGVLSTMDIVLMKLGHLLHPHLSWLLQMLLGMLTTVAHLLDNRHLIHAPVINVLKTIRQMALKHLNKVFSTFKYYRWTRDEIDAVFLAAVWPQLDKLPYEGLYRPTGLLRLLNTWTLNPRYWTLLSVVREDGESRELLYYVFQLLHGKNVNTSVVNMVLGMLENLLRSDEELQMDAEDGMDGGEADSPLEVGSTILMPRVQTGDVTLNIGLLIDHVPSILNYIRTVVANLSKQKGKNKSLPAKELTILARLSVYVTDPAISGETVSLLLPFLATRINRAQDLEVSILESVGNLLKLVTTPSDYLLPMVKLFSTLTSRSSRTALCDAAKVIGKKDPELKEIVQTIVKLNAYDRRMMDEPDYTVRLDGYKEAEIMLDARQDQTLMLLLLHNCCFFITHIDDMSLRDSSSACLQQIMKKIALVKGEDERRQLFTEIILKNLLPQIKEGIRNSTENIRHEYLVLLAQLVRSFPTHPLFAELSKLTDAELDLDFFVNITHIQLHRRARAMKRLLKQLKTTKLHVEVLSSYLLPLVTTFIKDDVCVKNSNLMDAVVETIGGLCQCLPWPRYLLVLRHYLQVLPKAANQKLIIRIVVSILDNFHFDLQNSLLFETISLPGTEQEEKKDDEKGGDEEAGDELAVEAAVDVEMDMDDKEDEEDSGIDDTDSVQHHQSQNEDIPRMKVCAPGLATRIHKLIIKNIIPQLHKCLTQKAKSDDEHKMAHGGKYAEDEEILRVPIALAMVKLLQHLPHKTLQNNLPGVLLKVCDFLKSRAQGIRETARNTLIKILQSLGPTYFSYILKELRATLRRGYQLHVLCFTVFTLLNTLAPSMKPGDLDCCITSLTEVFNEELFGAVSEEKEVDGIVGKIIEARTSKSYESYGLLSKYVSPASLGSLISPLTGVRLSQWQSRENTLFKARKVLETTQSHKVAKKASDVLQKVSLGLVDNVGLDIKLLLTFVYGITNDALPMLTAKKTKEEPKKQVQDPRLQKRDTFIVQPELPRGGKKPKAGGKTNSHIVIDFGLQVLHLLLKRSSLSVNNTDHLGMLDPFIATLVECLNSKHIRVTTTALRCVIWLFKFPLPSMETHIKTITKSLFVLLQNYASSGAAKGENMELITICFKAVTSLVRDVQFHCIDKEQLQVLLTFAEQDIHDYTRQTTAFGLLKAILSRRLVSPEMHDVIRKVEHLSVTASSPHIRLQSRQVVHQFLLDYPLGKQLESHLEFYLANLEYEHETGRESALEMMATIFTSFPQTLVVKYAEFFFMPLASCMVNDDSPKCRELAALAIKSLLAKLDNNNRDKIFAVCVHWLNDSKVKIRWLGALACIQIVEVESSKFERHLSTILPIIETQTNPDKYEQCESESEAVMRSHDHLLFSLLKLFMKILTECNIIKTEKWSSTLASIWENVEGLLLYGYSWVRLMSAQLMGLYFSSWTPNDLVNEYETRSKPVNKKKDQKQKQNGSYSTDYLLDDLNTKVYNLCGAFCKQFSNPDLDKDLADQILRNLVFLGKVLGRQSTEDSVKGSSQDTDHKGKDDKAKVAKLSWLISRLTKQAKLEAANNPNTSLKRCSLYKWLAAVSVELAEERLQHYLPSILTPLVQQLASNADTQDDGEARQLAQEVVDLLKSLVGVETFTQHYVKLNKTLGDKKLSRKRTKAMMAVANPDIAAKRKIKKNLAKQDARKRKIEDMRPAKKSKRFKKT